jgi:hypothetical protein
MPHFHLIYACISLVPPSFFLVFIFSKGFGRVISSRQRCFRMCGVLKCNFGSTQQTTSTMTCLVSRLVYLYNFLICAYKKEILWVAWQQQLVQLLWSCLMRRLFRSWGGWSWGNDLFLSPCSLSSTSSKIWCGTAWDGLWNWWRVPMYFS